MNTLLIGALGIASIIDCRVRKIPNWLILSMTLTGLIFQFSSAGTAGLIQGLLGFTIGIFLLYIPFSMGGVGGGDVKLLGAIGSFVGPAVLFQIFLASALFGGAFSLFEIARKRAVRKTLESIKQRILYAALRRQITPESGILFSPKPIRIPYALTIFCGYLCTYFLGGH